MNLREDQSMYINVSLKHLPSGCPWLPPHVHKPTRVYQNDKKLTAGASWRWQGREVVEMLAVWAPWQSTIGFIWNQDVQVPDMGFWTILNQPWLIQTSSWFLDVLGVYSNYSESSDFHARSSNFQVTSTVDPTIILHLFLVNAMPL